MNSNIFNINRFGKYLVYDLKNLWNNFGLSLIIISLIPVWGLLIRYLLSFFFGYDLDSGSVFPFISYELAVTVVVMAFGTKVYGHLTKKNACAGWIMIPASRLEKFVSMLVICCIVTPACFISIFGLSDMLMCMIPGYGQSAFEKMGSFVKMINFLDLKPSSLVVTEWGNWCINILAFTLGAIIFKKGKISKTLLAGIALGTIVGFLIFMFAGKASFTSYDISDWLNNMSQEKIEMYFKLFLAGFYLVFLGLLGFGIYLRTKYIQA